MYIPHIVLMFMVMLLFAVILVPLAKRIHLPFSALLVLGGFFGSELIVALGFDTGLRWHHFHDLIFFVLLPSLIFESAINLNIKLFFKNLLLILILSIPLMLLSALVAAIILYFGVSHVGFPFIAALLAGVILSATDPVAVLDLFKRLNAPKRLSVLVDGESLLNDATAIVAFGIILSMIQTNEVSFTISSSFLLFIKIFFGGIAVGLLIGGLSILLYRIKLSNTIQGVLSLVSAYGSFIIAEEIFHVSGVMAVLVTGLAIGWQRGLHPKEYTHFLEELWQYNAYIANAMVFLLMGITITVGMFMQQWEAMILGIVAILLSRAIAIFGFIPLLSKLPGIEKVSIGYQVIMFWGGLRGAIVLALALSLPLELDYWYTIQSIAYGVVIFTLFVQAPIIGLLMKKFRL
mgnify:CR=1 FL=1